MAIEYRFLFEESTQELVYSIDTDEPSNSTIRSKTPASWTRLDNCKCTNCPLNSRETSHCPAGLDIQKVIEDFGSLPAIQKADIQVVAPERTYTKHTGIEEGLRSLMGLIMANSACPILSQLKPMTYTHLPFASQAEFMMRSVGTFLVGQYFLGHSGRNPDWGLVGLVELNQELRLVNQALWQRVHAACEKDSNLKALLTFFTMSSSVSYSLDAQLSKIKHVFLAEKDLQRYGD